MQAVHGWICGNEGEPVCFLKRGEDKSARNFQLDFVEEAILQDDEFYFFTPFLRCSRVPLSRITRAFGLSKAGMYAGFMAS